MKKMKSYLILMVIIFCIAEAYSQDNGLYLTIQSLKEVKENYIIKATDVEKFYTDTLILISFRNELYVNGELKNRIDTNYGNLLQLIKGRSYVFKLFKPI